MVNGHLKDSGLCVNYMIKTNDSKRIRCYDNKNDIKYGKIIEAELRYRSILCKTLMINQNEVNQSLIDIEMETGRKHQIRSQLSHFGYPIIGDVKYGASQSFKTRDISLHSYAIVIRHPITKKVLIFTAPVPAVWAKRFGDDVHDCINQLIDEKKATIAD